MTEVLATRSIGLVREGSDSPLPVFNALQMTEALSAYQGLQKALDHAMPDQIMDLDGKKFRKKGYWRAVAVAFNLSVETLSEQREIAGTFKDGRPNFGYVITRRATAPNGRSVVADGTCFAVEKARRFKCPHPHPSWQGKTAHFPHSSCPDFDPEFQWRTLPGDATEHNVRGHASTRAFNRAVSDLVGFGEVSAEEVVRGEDHEEPRAATAPARQAGAGTTSAAAAPAAQPTAALAPGVTTVKSVKVTTGTNKKGEWTKYFVVFDDGRSGSTFSDTHGREFQAAEKATPKTPVNPVLVQTEDGKYWNITGINPVVAAPIADAPKPPDEPVTGPEKILTVREAKTAQGPYWIIQTEKRELVTDQEPLKADALAARKMDVGLVPEFVVIQTGHGPKNRLVKWVAEDVEMADAELEALGDRVAGEIREREAGED